MSFQSNLDIQHKINDNKPKDQNYFDPPYQIKMEANIRTKRRNPEKVNSKPT